MRRFVIDFIPDCADIVVVSQTKDSLMKRKPLNTSKKSKNSGRTSVERIYQRFFVPNDSPYQPSSKEDGPFEEPGPLKWVPSETTYGIHGH